MNTRGYDTVRALRKTRIVENSSLVTNKKSWSIMDDEMKETFMTSAEAAIDMIMELEPRLGEDDNDELLFEFQKDGKGVKGDVRDIVIKREDIEIIFYTFSFFILQLFHHCLTGTNIFSIVEYIDTSLRLPTFITHFVHIHFQSFYCGR